MSILINFLTFILIIVSVLLILVVLAQKTKDGGMGSALGGGMTESTFGADTGNVLSKTTIRLSIAFFILAFVLYVGELHVRKQALTASSNALPTLVVPTAAKPAAASPSTAASPAIAVPAASQKTDETKKP